jgi:hypothetical protein
MRNVQQRLISAPAGDVGLLLDELAGADSIWPTPAWPPLVLDAGLAPGSRGGHGPIRYRVADQVPGQRILFAFEPRSGFGGHHELRVTAEGAGGCLLTHTITSNVAGRMRVLWPVAIRWLHEALMRDLFDNAERAATGRLSRPPARWSRWVRLLRRISQGIGMTTARPGSGRRRARPDSSLRGAANRPQAS